MTSVAPVELDEADDPQARLDALHDGLRNRNGEKKLRLRRTGLQGIECGRRAG